MLLVERDHPPRSVGPREEVCDLAREDEYIGGTPDEIDEGLREIREHVLPLLHEQDRFKGFIALGDSQSGTLIGMTSGITSVWESEQAMQASEEVGDRARSETAEATHDTIEDVERYEVGLFEMSS